MGITIGEFIEIVKQVIEMLTEIFSKYFSSEEEGAEGTEEAPAV